MPNEEKSLSRAGRWRLLAFLILGCVALATMLYFPASTRRDSADALHLKTYLSDGRGLENNAEVRIAGIRVGRVSMVRVRPETPKAPVEVEMIIDPGYSMMVPSDSKVRLGRAGLVGNTVVDIDVQFAKGAAARNGDVLLPD